MMELTAGAILMMVSSEENKDTGFKPVLQVADLKLMTQSPERYRMTLSDGAFSYYAMLNTELSELVRSHRLQKGSVVHISLFINSVIQNHRVIVVIDLEPLEICNPIGDPKPLVLKGDASSSINAMGSNQLIPMSVFSKMAETMADILEEQIKEFVKKDASLRHAFEAEMKAREAAEQKLIAEQEANKQLHEEFHLIKTAAEQKLIAEQEVNKQLHEELDYIKTQGLANQTASLFGFFEAVFPAACDVGTVEALIALREKHPDIELAGLPSADWARQELAAKKKIVNDLFLAKVWGGLNS